MLLDGTGAGAERWHMLRALELAAHGRGTVEPNPMVGCVLTDASGRKVGEGWHRVFGGPHAEIDALGRAANVRGGTAYVTLEPCCHHGKTPPCADRLIAAGLARVVVAMRDPFPQVDGGGLQRLRDAGVAVEVGLCESEACRLNAPYLTLVGQGRPYFHAKWAMSADGRIATAAGESQWITGERSRRHAHVFRGTVDAIVVGVGTVLADDPSLTARPSGARTPTRVVFDSHLRTPPDGRLVATARQTPTVVFTTTSAPDAARLREAGVEVVTLPPADAKVDVAAAAAEMGRRRWTNVLLEGGSELLGSFLAAGLIDASRLYLAPKLIGGREAKGPLGGAGIAALADAAVLTTDKVEQLGDDVFWSLHRPNTPGQQETASIHPGPGHPGDLI